MSFVKTSLILSAFLLIGLPSLAIAQQADYKYDMFEEERKMHEVFLKKTRDTFIVYDSIQLDSLVEANMAEYHIPGVALCVFKDSQIVYTRNFGYARVADGIEVADTTLFVLASISKTFVASAAMQLWENGLLDLDADINDYLPFNVDNPFFPDDSITMRMLLCHTSSIDRLDANWIPDIVYGGDYQGDLGQYLQDYLDPSGADYYAFNYSNNAPGTDFEYSNYAFALAGYIIEEIAIDNSIAASLEQYCQDSIFAPLGMNETSWFLSNLDTFNIAMPYWYNSVTYIPYGHQGLPIYPCAQLRTSSIQLARHMMAFMNYGSYYGTRILDSSTAELMMTDQFPSVPTDYPGEIQGIGWYDMYSTEDGWSYWGHSGSLWGCKTWMLFDPVERVGFLCLTNSTGNGTGMSYIMNGLAGFSRDPDMDAVVGGLDNCPFDYNPDQMDADTDGTGDLCDNCSGEYNPEQEDTDIDNVGDSCDNCIDIYNPNQIDSDLDGTGDLCEYICGDANGSGGINILDITYIVSYLYKGGPAPDPAVSADADGSGGINILDITFIVNYLYKGGPEPNC